MSTRRTRQGKKKIETTTQDSGDNIRQRAVKNIPYRLAVKKTSSLTKEPAINDKATVHTADHQERATVSTPRHQERATVSTPRHQERATVSTHRHQQDAAIQTTNHQERATVSTPRNKERANISTPRNQERSTVSTPHYQERATVSTPRHQQHATVSTSHDQEHAESDSEMPPLMSWKSPEDQPRIISGSIGKVAKFGTRKLSACKKIKPMFLFLLSTVLATPVLLGIIWNKYSSDSVSSSVYQGYEKFSHDMLQLQKQYIHQSAWLWHGLRITAWHALTEPLYTMPMALLIVIPHGHEWVGFCIATKAIHSFNKIHDQKTTKQVTCMDISRGRSGNKTTTEVSLAIRTARQSHQSAVLIDHLEKLSNATLPVLDKFLDPDHNQPENKMLIFTFYVPPARCNPDFVRKFLVEAWISRVFARPTLAKKLIDNAVFITTYDGNVKCK